MTVKRSTELVVTIPPMRVQRTVLYGPMGWQVQGFGTHTTALGALEAIRTEVKGWCRHPVGVEIAWEGVSAEFIPPTTASGWS